MYYTYMLRCLDGSIYTGITTDPRRRLNEHKEGGQKAARYTRTHGAEEVLALWESAGRSDAGRLEYLIKTLTKPQKERLAADGDLKVFEGRLERSRYRFVGKAAAKIDDKNVV